MKSRHRGGTASAFNWAKRTSFEVDGVSRTAAKCIMLVLSDYVDERWSTYAGQRRVGEESETSERVVRRFLAAAELAGYLCRERRAEGPGSGRGGPEARVYLHVDGSRELCPCECDQAANLAAGLDDQPANGATTNRPNRLDQPAKSVPIGKGAPLSMNPEEDPKENPAIDPLLGFPDFWEQYPKRNGKREGRGKAEQVWRRLSYEERKAAWRGACHYGRACDSGLTIAADAFRWLRDRRWEDWQDPAIPSTSGPRRGMTSALSEAGADELLRQYGQPNGGPPPVAGRALPSAT